MEMFNFVKITLCPNIFFNVLYCNVLFCTDKIPQKQYVPVNNLKSEIRWNNSPELLYEYKCQTCQFLKSAISVVLHHSTVLLICHFTFYAFHVYPKLVFKVFWKCCQKVISCKQKKGSKIIRNILKLFKIKSMWKFFLFQFSGFRK